MKKIGRAISESIDELVHIERSGAGPNAEHAILAGKINRRSHEYEVPDALRVQRSEHSAHRPAHAVGQDVHFFNAGALAQKIHYIDHVAVDVIIECQMPIGIRRDAPIHHVRIKTPPDKIGDHTTPLL